jgi:diacylglycerol kinase
MQNPIDHPTTEVKGGDTAGADNRVRNDDNIVSPFMRSPTLIASFRFAFEGVYYAFRTQRNFRLHTLMTILVLIAGIVLQISFNQWAVLAIVIGVVFQTELTNTAVEALVDKISPEWHGLAKIAKDCSAAAVLMSAAAAAVAGLLIFVPKLWNLVVR